MVSLPYCCLLLVYTGLLLQVTQPKYARLLNLLHPSSPHKSKINKKQKSTRVTALRLQHKAERGWGNVLFFLFSTTRRNYFTLVKSPTGHIKGFHLLDRHTFSCTRRPENVKIAKKKEQAVAKS